MASLNWATADEEYTPSTSLSQFLSSQTCLIFSRSNCLHRTAIRQVQIRRTTQSSDKTQGRIGRPHADQRRALRRRIRRVSFTSSVHWHSGSRAAHTLSSLLVASQYDPFSIVDKLYPYLGGSASIVVHSPHVQVVTNLQTQLRDRLGYLGPTVTEGFLRRYQVLPGRTHPMMNASGSGGFILHVIKMCVTLPYKNLLAR